MHIRRALALLVASPILLAPALAFAQTGAPVDLPPVSLPIAVTTLVSLLLGVLNLIAQGSILNLVTVPKTWAPPATALITFFTGVSSFLGTASQPWTGSTAFYALAFGLFGLFGGSLPAFALHAHTTLPKMLRAARMGAKAIPLALGLGLTALLGASEAGCTPAQTAEWQNIEQTVLNDVNAGDSRAQIIADVGKIVGLSAPVDQLVLDALNLLIDAGAIAAGQLANATALRDALAAEKAQRSGNAVLPLSRLAVTH